MQGVFFYNKTHITGSNQPINISLRILLIDKL